MRRVGITTGVAAAAAALALMPGGPGRPQAARANPAQVSIMMDDDQLVYRNDATRDRAMTQMKSLGVEWVRVTMLWRVVALQARAGRRLGDPAAYPARNWDRYDGVVREAHNLGLGVYFDVTGPGPPWAQATPPHRYKDDAATWMPSARAFYDFVAAVGKRYSGRYRARNGKVLPRISTWSLWNEPNQAGWLSPQFLHGRPVSPSLYRTLFLYGRKALDDTGHGRDFIMAGETAPLGYGGRTDHAAMAPKTFISELLCMDTSGAPYTGAVAAKRGCDDFERLGPIRASAWAHHPYTKHNAPTQPDSNPDAITLANLGDLPALLDRGAAATHDIATGLPIMSTEFGYETNPPDPFQGIPLDRQAEYIDVGDMLAYFNPRVYSQTQFQLVDAPPVKRYRKNTKSYWSTYQSGLEFQDGRPKPSLRSYQLALAIHGSSGHTYDMWGHLRFRPHPPPGGVDYVQIQYQRGASGAWAPLGVPIATANAEGFFEGPVTVPGAGNIRAAWLGSPGHYSRAVAVSG